MIREAASDNWSLTVGSAQSLYCSSFLDMTHFLLWDYNLLPKEELHWSPWVSVTKVLRLVILYRHGLLTYVA